MTIIKEHSGRMSEVLCYSPRWNSETEEICSVVGSRNATRVTLKPQEPLVYRKDPTYAEYPKSEQCKTEHTA